MAPSFPAVLCAIFLFAYPSYSKVATVVVTSTDYLSPSTSSPAVDWTVSSLIAISSSRSPSISSASSLTASTSSLPTSEGSSAVTSSLLTAWNSVLTTLTSVSVTSSSPATSSAGFFGPSASSSTSSAPSSTTSAPIFIPLGPTGGSAPAGTKCGLSADLCPACNDLVIPDTLGKYYWVACNAGLEAEKPIHEQDPTGEACQRICDSYDASHTEPCIGIVIKPNGTCVLGTGPRYEYLGDRPGHTLLVPQKLPKSRVTSTSSTNSTATSLPPPPVTLITSARESSTSSSDASVISSPTTTLSPATVITSSSASDTSLTISFVSTSSRPSKSAHSHRSTVQSSISSISATTPSTISTSSNGTSATIPAVGGPPAPFATCAYNALACPRCDGASVQDGRGNAYDIYCGTEAIGAAGAFPVSRSETAAGCMAACDAETWCAGATFQSPSRCILARGPAVSTQLRRGYTALLPATLGFVSSVLEPLAAAAATATSLVSL